MIDEQLEHNLKPYLQDSVQFIINDKVVREGKLMLFIVKDFHVSFIITTKKKQNKTYEVPIPYRSFRSDCNLIMDYSLDLIHHNDPVVRYLITAMNSKINKKSKLYDNTLTIRVGD